MVQQTCTLTPTADALNQHLTDLEKEHKQLVADLKKRARRIERLQSRQGAGETAARLLTDGINRVKCRVFVRQALSPEFINARNILTEKIRLVQSDTITIARQKELNEEIDSFWASLQKLCIHPFVFSYDGYKSYSSFEDSRSGNRVCTLCNLSEQSKGAPEDIYEILADDGTRMVLRDLRKKEDRPKLFEQEWFTHEFLERLFDSSAGNGNVSWPIFRPNSVLKF